MTSFKSNMSGIKLRLAALKKLTNNESKKTDNDENAYLSAVRLPKFMVFEVTSKCNLRCRMCHSWKNSENNDQFSLEDFEKFINSIPAQGKKQILLNFVGGEPLLRKDIFSLLEIADKKNFYTSLCSNGTLIQEQNIALIKKSNLLTFSLSVDSLNPDLHDELRGVKGAHKKTLQSLSFFENGLGKITDITLQTIIINKNIEELPLIAEMVQNSKVLGGIKFMALTPVHYSDTLFSWETFKKDQLLWPQDKIKLNKAVDELIFRKQSRNCKIINSIGQLENFKKYFETPESLNKKCELALNFLFINLKGDAFLCSEFEPIGNIRRQTFREIWYSDKRIQMIDRVKKCNRNCDMLINCFPDELEGNITISSGEK